jgi:hypothetical protein
VSSGTANFNKGLVEGLSGKLDKKAEYSPERSIAIAVGQLHNNDPKCLDILIQNIHGWGFDNIKQEEVLQEILRDVGGVRGRNFHDKKKVAAWDKAMEKLGYKYETWGYTPI